MARHISLNKFLPQNFISCKIADGVDFGLWKNRIRSRCPFKAPEILLQMRVSVGLGSHYPQKLPAKDFLVPGVIYTTHDFHPTVSQIHPRLVFSNISAKEWAKPSLFRVLNMGAFFSICNFNLQSEDCRIYRNKRCIVAGYVSSSLLPLFYCPKPSNLFKRNLQRRGSEIRQF